MTSLPLRAKLRRLALGVALGVVTLAANLVLAPAASASASPETVLLPPRSTPVSVSMSGTFVASESNPKDGTGWVEHMKWSVSWSGTLGQLFNDSAWARMKALEKIPHFDMQAEVTSTKGFNTAEEFAFQQTSSTGTITGTYRPQCTNNPQSGSKFPKCNQQGLGPLSDCPAQHLVPVAPDRPTFSATVYGFPLSPKTELAIAPFGGQKGTWEGIPANSLAAGSCYGAGPYLYGSQAGGQLVGGGVSFFHGGTVPFRWTSSGEVQQATLVVKVSASGSSCSAPATAAAVGGGSQSRWAAADATACCSQVDYYSVRGSGESLTRGAGLNLGGPGESLYSYLAAHWKASVPLRPYANGYPAINVGWSVVLDALTAGSPWWLRLANGTLLERHYAKSVDEGVALAVSALNRLAGAGGSCIVVSGYSQGADVVRRALARLPDATLGHIVVVELFGDPNFKGAEPNVVPLGWGATHGAQGIMRVSIEKLGFRSLPPPPPFPKVLVYSWCNDLDAVCGLVHNGLHFQTSVEGHSEYLKDNKDKAAAADRVLSALARRGLET